jgi:hypothetical protein
MSESDPAARLIHAKATRCVDYPELAAPVALTCQSEVIDHVRNILWACGEVLDALEDDLEGYELLAAIAINGAEGSPT